MGLVNRVVPDAELEATSTTMPPRSPTTRRSLSPPIKRMVGEALKDPADRDLELCDRLYANALRAKTMSRDAAPSSRSASRHFRAAEIATVGGTRHFSAQHRK